MADATTLEDWLARLERQHPVAIDMGLERVTAVAARLGLKARALAGRVITVAGTNGKGSTVAMLDALAREHGWRSAAYTSPHLQRYNERLCFDGQEVDDASLIEAFEAVDAARLADEEVSLTYFEVGTLAALWLIARQQPDIALLEVGLGGRLDAVNVIDPDVAVVTTVAQDHAAFLGTHLETIGQEKAGIMRSERPAVLGSTALPASVRQHAESLAAPVFALGEHFGWHAAADGWQWHGEHATGEVLSLHGLPALSLPLDNAATALQALTLAGMSLEEPACQRAFGRAALAGRLQWQGPWCLDVGHNPHAAAYVATYLAQRPPRGRRFCLLGMLADKDAKGVIEALAPQVDAWVPVSLSGDRARDAEQLASFLKACDAQVLHCAASPDAGVRWLHANMDNGDEVLVCGSFWTVAEALATLEILGVMASPRSVS